MRQSSSARTAVVQSNTDFSISPLPLVQENVNQLRMNDLSDDSSSSDDDIQTVIGLPTALGPNNATAEEVLTPLNTAASTSGSARSTNIRSAVANPNIGFVRASGNAVVTNEHV